MREALEALIRTYRTLQSGVYYETRPQNPLAGAIYSAMQNAVAELRRMEQEGRGVAHTRDAQVLGLLVFLQRLELDRNNGRRLGRAFIDFLRSFFAPDAAAAAGGAIPDCALSQEFTCPSACPRGGCCILPSTGKSRFKLLGGCHL